MKQKLIESKKRNRLLDIHGRWNRLTRGVLKIHYIKINKRWIGIIRGLAQKNPGSISFKTINDLSTAAITKLLREEQINTKKQILKNLGNWGRIIKKFK